MAVEKYLSLEEARKEKQLARKAFLTPRYIDRARQALPGTPFLNKKKTWMGVWGGGMTPGTHIPPKASTRRAFD